MTCFHPIPAYRSVEVNPATGKRGLVFNSKSPLRLAEGLSFSVPCGRCIGCRLDRTRDWAVRCSHENQFHGQSSFLTLTYNKKNIPDDYSVDVPTHQKFMKRLREKHGQVRFFACGEYGSEEGAFPYQPHYHYLIFGWRPGDLVKWKKTEFGQLYTSAELERLWPFGFSTVGNVTFKSAGYCARYVTKKITGDIAADHYSRIHPISGRPVQVEPEFALQSRRPGLGDAWYSTFKSEIYPSDFCVIEGKKYPVPKYYVKKYEEEERTRIKRRRKIESNKHRADSTSARLRVREQVQVARANLLKRDLK